jgi:hypothetical protein
MMPVTIEVERVFVTEIMIMMMMVMLLVVIRAVLVLVAELPVVKPGIRPTHWSQSALHNREALNRPIVYFYKKCV